MSQNNPAYPLAQVIEIKKRRVEEAEKNVKEKKLVLQKEEEKLEKAKAAQNEVLKHRNDKMAQLRQTLDEGTTSDKIQEMKLYLDLVKEKLAKEDKKVKDQEKQVAVAQKNLETAQKELRDKQQEVDKLELHRKEWTIEAAKEISKKEANEQDEIGSIMHGRKQSEGKKGV